MVETAGMADYRDKYRKAVEEQERLEKQFTLQVDILRKTLLRLSDAAQGLDRQLDSALNDLRVKFRGASGEEIVKQLEYVQHVVEVFEGGRIEKSERAAKDTALFIDQLLELKLPNDLEKSLKSFNQGLHKRFLNLANYPEVLNELSKLQLLALNAASNPEEGFWSRMKGGKTLNPKDNQLDLDEQPKLETEVTPASVEEDPPTPSVAGEVQTAPTAIEFEPGSEENYEQVAKRIASTLEGLVERIEPNEVVKHKVDIVKLRIKRGMDWYVLAVTLEDIRDILLLRYLQNDQDFSEYLKKVNQELHGIGEVLGLAVNREEALKASSDRFSDQVSHQLGALQSSVDSATDLDTLKDEVSNNLHSIQEALGEYKSSQSEYVSLSDQLKTLINRVQTIEQESEKTKELLEEERHRATHDSLTELPNREAYNERAFHEMQRFRRYCRPLALAVCDIDHFKRVNDTYGHQAGDKVIKLIAKLLSTQIRKVDFVARYGGEEFVMLLPETTAEQAVKVLDKIRQLMEKTPFRFKQSPVQITLSFGLAEFTEEDSVEDVFERADKALYDAKKQGRNCCMVYRAEAASTDE